MRKRDKQRIVKMFLRGESINRIVYLLWKKVAANAVRWLDASDIEEIIREHMRSTIWPRGGKKR